MENDNDHEEIEVIMNEPGAVDISLEITEEAGTCDKSDKSSRIQPSQDTNMTYSTAILVQSPMSQSVICPEESTDQPSETLPTLAVAPSSDSSQKQLQGDDINQAWFTTKEDKDSLQGKGVKWRQGMWAKDESDLLRNNILEYCKTHSIQDPHDVIFKQSKDERKTFYRTIAKGIHRPLFAIYRRVLRMYETGNHFGKYSSEEVERLKDLRKKHGNDWTAIGVALGRSASSVKDRCRLLKEKCTSGKWTDEEEERLSSAVRQLTGTKPGDCVTTGILWTDVAKMVGTRSEKQCRSKWLNYLNWKECGGKEWNKTDEIDLIRKIYELGIENENEIDWVALANGWVSVRSPQWLRSKWWTIKKHVPGAQAMSFPDTIAYLHSHYARNLRHRLDRHDPRYLQIPTSEQYPLTNLLNTSGSLSSLTTCAAISTNVGQAIAVDGEIFMTREDDKGSDGLNGFEMVQLRALPSTDPSQPTSYIIEPVHCSVTGSAPSYILHQTSSHQGTKLVKITGNSSILRQVVSCSDVGNSQLGGSNADTTILSGPAIVSSLAQVTHTEASSIVSSESLDVRVDQVRESSSDERNGSYVTKKAVDILEENQPLDCIAEQEISTTADQERENSDEFETAETSCYKDEKAEKSHDSPVSNQSASLNSVGSQSLDINFSTTDNTIYPRSLIPGLVSGGQASASEIVTNEVLIPQPTLPDNILQSQGDEPTFLPDSVITVSSPLAIVAGSLAEVTVPNTSTDISSSDLIMEGEFRISNVSGSDVTMETDHDSIVLD